ncbi:hypothetical protein LJC29_04600 [Bacteroides sp. OttesenSCG-928-N06]|nr:hypothetical protein [Bacteroides sp. OttesenSCG-928-N06]
MKKIVYYTTPLIVAGATFVGRIYWMYSMDSIINLEAYNWNYENNINDILRTAFFILLILVSSSYLLLMLSKHKKKKRLSFIERILFVIVMSVFVEVILNGVLFVYCIRGGMPFAVFYYLTYIITYPIALILSYVWLVSTSTNKI